MNVLLVTNLNKINLYDCNNYSFKGKLPIKLLDSDSREPNEIVSMQKCQNEEFVAIISGKNLLNTNKVLN